MENNRNKNGSKDRFCNEPVPDTWVYMVYGGGLIKIGRTDDVNKRFASLRTMSPVPLTLIWCAPGFAEEETTLHRDFDHYREHGEWFRPSESIRVFLDRHDRQTRKRQSSRDKLDASEAQWFEFLRGQQLGFNACLSQVRQMFAEMFPPEAPPPPPPPADVVAINARALERLGEVA